MAHAQHLGAHLDAGDGHRRRSHLTAGGSSACAARTTSARGRFVHPQPQRRRARPSPAWDPPRSGTHTVSFGTLGHDLPIFRRVRETEHAVHVRIALQSSADWEITTAEAIELLAANARVALTHALGGSHLLVRPRSRLLRANPQPDRGAHRTPGRAQRHRTRRFRFTPRTETPCFHRSSPPCGTPRRSRRTPGSRPAVRVSGGGVDRLRRSKAWSAASRTGTVGASASAMGTRPRAVERVP